jgi:hypothetical protein
VSLYLGRSNTAEYEIHECIVLADILYLQVLFYTLVAGTVHPELFCSSSKKRWKSRLLAQSLETQGIITVSQLFETHLSGRIENSVSSELMTAISRYPALQHKVKTFVRAFSQQMYHNKYVCPRYNLAILVNQDTNLSRRYCLKCRDLLDESIGVAPAYQTRIRDGIAIRPGQRAFTSAYNLLHLPLITSKTRETAFQILNRTTWTNNKAFKSRMRPDPNCD